MLLRLAAVPLAGCAARAGAGPGSTLAVASSAKSPVALAGSGPFPVQGMAAFSANAPLKRVAFRRRALGPKDVAIELHYCGVCHSDIHTIRGDWGPVQYPQIVGHELAGEVVAVGSSVSKFRVGARVGVGTMVDSCRQISKKSCHCHRSVQRDGRSCRSSSGGAGRERRRCGTPRGADREASFGDREVLRGGDSSDVPTSFL